MAVRGAGKKIRALVLIFSALLLIPGVSPAAGKKKRVQAPPAAETGRRVMRLAPIENVRISMPDDKPHDFGPDFEASLTTLFTHSPKLVLLQKSEIGPRGEGALSFSKADDDYVWEGGVLPAATVKIGVKALTFQTGSRGARMLYGFDERMPNEPNEFPLYTFFGEASWFDDFFDRKGVVPFDSRSGLDLGDGFNINVLFAWLSVKYATYHSKLHLNIEVDAPLAGIHELREVKVLGKGFFYDVAGAYGLWNGGIQFARKTAMTQAFDRALVSASKVIEDAVAVLPLTAVINHYQDGKVFLGTGQKAKIPAGTLYRGVDDPQLVVEVEQSLMSGSVARLVSGDPNSLHVSMPLIQTREIPKPWQRGALKSASELQKSSSEPRFSTQTIELPQQNLDKPDLQGLAPNVTRWQAFLKSLVETATLPYRIWRYFQYDQKLHRNSDFGTHSAPHDIQNIEEAEETGDQRAAHHYGGAESWAADARKTAWSKLIGLDRAVGPGAQSVVAVLDSGVDYNHPVIHDSIWLNSTPSQDSDGRQDRYGWDFVSGDSRPFDDGYHGTQIASAVLAVAPLSRIMAVKVFNPWGVTNSSAILGAFKYAVDRGAKVIVCGWTTRLYSKAMELGVAYARDHGVLVVTAAGDLGADIDRVPTFPASFSGKYENVISVAATDDSGGLFGSASYGDQRVQVAAPGSRVFVAEPRLGYTTVDSSGMAAAIVAGAIARSSEALSRAEFLNRSTQEFPSLVKTIEGGRLLHLPE